MGRTSFANGSPSEINKILSCIGKPVTYTYPGDEPSQHNILRDRSVFESPYGGTVPYWDVVDLIEFKGEKEQFIRIGYYRKPSNASPFPFETSQAPHGSVVAFCLSVLVYFVVLGP